MKEACHLLTQLDKLLLDFVINLILPSAPSKLEFFFPCIRRELGDIFGDVLTPQPPSSREIPELSIYSVILIQLGGLITGH